MERILFLQVLTVMQMKLLHGHFSSLMLHPGMLPLWLSMGVAGTLNAGNGKVILLN
jgi:hypothetical protein